ncbi:MAG: hypothetical protein WCB01_15865 [Candidatus Cybelea sp.]
MMEQLIMLHLALELKFTATGQLKSETRNNRVASLLLVTLIAELPAVGVSGA